MQEFHNESLESSKQAGPTEIVLVHRCTDTEDREKPPCDCAEYISRSEANELVREGKAEWLTSRRNGKPYTFRHSIVIRADVEAIRRVAAERASANDAAIQDRKAKRKQAAIENGIREVIATFRAELTDAENQRWTDENIIDAFQHLDTNPQYLQGLDAKANLRNPPKNAAEDWHKEMADAARIYAALHVGVFAYWEVILKSFDLPANEKMLMTEADKGKGLLVSGGYDAHKIAEIDEHRSDNEDGHNQRGDFVPGSGGLCVGVSGEQKPIDPIFNIGHGPDSDETENEAHRIRKQWFNELGKPSEAA